MKELNLKALFITLVLVLTLAVTLGAGCITLTGSEHNDANVNADDNSTTDSHTD